MKKLTLVEFAGQKCDVMVKKRDDDTKYVTFLSERAYGFPKLELDKMETLLQIMKKL